MLQVTWGKKTSSLGNETEKWSLRTQAPSVNRSWNLDLKDIHGSQEPRVKSVCVCSIPFEVSPKSVVKTFASPSYGFQLSEILPVISLDVFLTSV